jgi:hypothetical protein
MRLECLGLPVAARFILPAAGLVTNAVDDAPKRRMRSLSVR